ncbi:hypothetical protein [Aquabacter cavernae]|uniref:hypothetical protein n=1 Tax=Aquabacter cavernae TaxID=2496029 RepID=UPI000F8E1AF7|nr:hypothetical protein [Aquabacter cavernae]
MDEPTDNPLPPQAEAGGRKPKTAIVLIHGMGEQRPMGTLWGFVEAAWCADRRLVDGYDAEVYAKPDTINDSFELRRVTTRYWKGEPQRRVDFFEFYWAHLMRGNTVHGVVGWLVSLFVRWPSSVPRSLLWAWLVGLALLALCLFFAGAAMLPGEVAERWIPQGWAAGLAAVSFFLSLFAASWLAPVAGDAARYFSPNPDNVDARQKIMRAGVQVIERLTATGDYDRIILVGHSLGSAIGLDILHHAFGRVTRERWEAAHADGSPAVAALAALEKAAGQLLEAPGDPAGRAAFRTAQRAYAAALRAGWSEGISPWLVTDFVTLGSPLSKADILVARTAGELELFKARREIPTCPPKLETRKPPKFSYRTGGAAIPHHGAVYGPTVWTNVYQPHRFVACGDIISGPVAPLFGPGVMDLELPQPGFRFTHNDYWIRPQDASPGTPVDALRRGLNLRLEAEGDLWGNADTGGMIATNGLPGRPNGAS